MSENRTSDILLELRKSFLDEKRNLQDHIVEIETEIRECKDYIDSLNKKDDCDYNLFSPRSASRVYKDQVFEKQTHIEELEESMRSYYKKLSEVTKKLDSLNELHVDEIKEVISSSVKYSNETDFLKLQEDDRHRIAADLHDGVLQNLSLVMHNIELAVKFMDYDIVRAKLEMESNRKLVKETIDDIRNTIYELRPTQFDDFGFKKTLENQIEYYAARSQMSIDYHIEEFEDIDNIILLTVYRVCQELINNSIKHSKGNNISIQVISDSKSIIVEVSDDGIGISDEDFNKVNHYGLKILKERVAFVKGKVSFPKVEKGTKVIIEVPIVRNGDK